MRCRRLSWLTLSIAIVLLLGTPVLARGSRPTGHTGSLFGLLSQEGGETRAVALQGSYAYVGTGPRLDVLNLTDPGAPVRVGRSAPLPDIVQGIAISGNTAYVAAGTSGLHMIDVSNPSAPAIRRTLSTPGWTSTAFLSGAHLYVAERQGGLRIVEVSNSLDVARLTVDELGGEVWGITVAGSVAYVAAGAGGLVTVDITAPSQPRIMGRHTGPVVTSVAVFGPTAYAVDSRDLKLLALDISDPSLPRVLRSRSFTGVPAGLAGDGEHLYVAVGESGIDVFEIDPEAGELSYPVTYDTPGMARAVALAGSYAYVADGWAGLRCIEELYEGASATEAGFHPTLGNLLGLDTRGTLAYIASGENGLNVVDVTNPAAPLQMGRLDTSGYAHAVVVSDTLALIADGAGGLVLVDVTTSAVPGLLGELRPPEKDEVWRSIAVQDGLAFVAAASAGMRVVDVTVPEMPSLVSHYEVEEGHRVWSVVVEGPYAYLAAGASGVHVLDISNPASPVKVAVIPTGDFAWALALSEGRLYIADIDGGLRVVSVAAPTQAIFLSVYKGVGSVTDVAIAGEHALLATTQGIAILEISPPNRLTLQGALKLAGTPQAVTAIGDTILVSTLDGGMWMIDRVALADVHTVYLPLVVGRP